MYWVSVLCFGKSEITCHPFATMAECIVLCLGYLSYVLGYLSYVLDISLMSGALVLCLEYWSYVWNISLMSGILVLCLGISLMYIIYGIYGILVGSNLGATGAT